MLSQIRQISDGNHNTVFVKNKEQKFNLDKEIHDLECWKQSRNHVYRKEERELLNQMDKLRHQQEYLHHLDEERSGHVRGSQGSQRRHSMQGPVPIPLSQNNSEPSPSRKYSTEEMDPHTTPVPSVTPSAALPPVKSGTDNRALHRADAHTNICLICQLPKWSHGHPSGEALCCCEEQEGAKSLTRRNTTAGYEAHSAGHFPPPIQIGQRRHSLMMARLGEKQQDHQHPPGYTGKGQRHSNDHLNSQQDHAHIHRHLHNHVHMHHDSVHRNNFHRHQHHMEHVNSHRGHTHRNMHGGQGPHATDQHGNHFSLHEHAHHRPHAREHSGNSENQRHNHHGDNATKFTPGNSPRRYSRQSFTHNDPHVSSHEPMHPNASAHQSHGRRHSTIGSFGYSAQQNARTRDHELHWDRHQVCQLKGMITDPHYKEQLEVETGGTYPWSGLYASNNASIEDINDLKNCRYLRFSKLNLMNMKENPEEEVEVFEKNQLPG